ncbi:MAG: flavodoxin family protein [Bacteroidetes bacterium HGW-Bacteroidetes-17]|jgi:multimeric flavodoxin WrbA|nr:MAG: flavodoxin family protein [Bacteroidetes bacterium HGW-Bacteroidetes-17]
MKTILIDCNPDKADIVSENMVKRTEQIFKNQGQNTQRINIRDLDIRFCFGCWDCWVKTPGKCTIKDEMHLIHQAVINADHVIFLSPLKMGFITTEMKKIQERLIPMLLPNIDIVEGEFHHKKRYEKYPGLSLLMLREINTTDEDIKINQDIFKRFALNFRSEVLFSTTYGYQFEEVIYEACNFERFSEKAKEQLKVANG